jgi:hypothetical protein
MDTSISSNSSVSSTINVCDYAVLPDVSDFIPTSLLSGHGTIPIDVNYSFQATLDIMSKINFSTLSKDKSIEWNVALSHSSALEMNINTHRQAFANKMLPLMKKHRHNLFIKLAFPSMIEVTMTSGNALSTFGLTSTSPLTRMLFDKFVFKAQGSSSADPIFPEDNSLLTPRHENDTPDICDNLWVNHGIGTFTVKEISRTRSTVTNICHDVVHK